MIDRDRLRQTPMNTDERWFLMKSGRTPKSGKKFRHAEIFSPIGFGCRFASRMNCDELGWSRWTGILWRFWNFQNREQIGVCGTAVLIQQCCAAELRKSHQQRSAVGRQRNQFAPARWVDGGTNKRSSYSAAWSIGSANPSIAYSNNIALLTGEW